MTIRDAKLELAKLGMVLSKTKHGEFRVNFKGGSEATAYYTASDRPEDLEDAVGTGKHMGQQRQVHGSRKAATELHDAVADAAKKYFEEAKAQGAGDDESSILEKLKKSWPTLLVSYLARVVKNVMTGNILDENRAIDAARVSQFSVSETLDRVSDHLESLRREMPREASNLRGLALRLDRVANTLEAEQEVTARVSKIENELDDLGVDFTVAPNSSGKQATYIYAYKGQLNSRDEASVLGRIAKKHGSLFENTKNNRTYKITVPHHV